MNYLIVSHWPERLSYSVLYFRTQTEAAHEYERQVNQGRIVMLCAVLLHTPPAPVEVE